eukprot:5823891-Ditylum_brightwellii.AAC.1
MPSFVKTKGASPVSANIANSCFREEPSWPLGRSESYRGYCVLDLHIALANTAALLLAIMLAPWCSAALMHYVVHIGPKST